MPFPEPPASTGATSTSAKGPSHSRDPSAVKIPRSGTLDRKPSVSYGHHRQTSIVHGVQHSRNASLATTHASSPLSPNLVVEQGAPHSGRDQLQDDGPDFNFHPGLASDANGPQNFGSMGDRGALLPNNDSSTTRKLDRMHSGKARRDHGHHHSHSRHHQTEVKTVGEYALYHLFNSFLTQAEQKIKACTINPLGPEPYVESICGPEIDPNFDQLVSALGHVARQKPKPLIDSLMLWRKAKADTATKARGELENNSHIPPLANALPRRNTEPLHMAQGSSLSGTTLRSTSANMVDREQVIRAERQSAVSIYLLCRVLMEVISQSTLQSITPEMANKLEDIIFGQLKQPDLEQLASSPLKMANWKIFAQLLGVMSEIDFDSVSDRFFADLEQSHRGLTAKGANIRELEGTTELVIQGMRHLCVKTYPEDAWERSCGFIKMLGGFFFNSHGQRIKQAYCQILVNLLLPIAATATSELNMPKWRQAIEAIAPRITQLMAKPRYWQDAVPLFSILLCVYPTESFAGQWLQIVISMQPKLKDRTSRGLALQAICRLTWIYINRVSDTQNVTIRNLEEVIKLVFPPGKKSYVSTDPSIAEPLIQLVRIIGFKHQDLCFRTIIFPLVNSELFAAGKDLKIELLEPEKTVIGIRAFLVIMSDLEKGEQGRPPFPQSFTSEANERAMPTLPPSRTILQRSSPFVIREERLSRPVMTSSFGDTAKEYYTRFCEILGKITLICDNTFGGQAVLDEKFSGQTPKTPIADTFGFSRRDEHQAGADQRQGFYELLHVAVQALPRCLSVHIQLNSLVNLLCTGTAHVQSNIAVSSAQSLKSIARQGYAQQITMGFGRFIFNFDDRYSTMSDGGLLGHGHVENTLQLYVELLQIWIEEIKAKAKEAASAPDNPQSPENQVGHLDISGIFAYVDNIESHGVFFLCSQSRRVRSFAVMVLRLIVEFDHALGKSNKRVIEIMEKESVAVMDFRDDHLSVAERSRLQRGLRKSNSQHTLIELCGSEDSYDAALWYKIFPNLIRISFDRCPFAVTLTREIICSRILQMYKGIQFIAEPARTPQYPAFDLGQNRTPLRTSSTPPEVMIEQFKLYLTVACTTLTTTGSLSKDVAQDQQHARKTSKSSQPGTEKIVSARSLFNYMIPLLGASLATVREAVALALGSINVNIYRMLLDCLQSVVLLCNEEARGRIHQRTLSSPRRSNRTDLLRTEITYVYKLTSHFLQNEQISSDDWILNNLITYTKDLKIFLSDSDVQTDWEFHKLRRHYCGLMEELFEGVSRTKDPSRWMPFEARKSAFALMEDWCGYSPNQTQISQREESMKQSIMEHSKDQGDRGNAMAQMEIEKRNLKTAALSAMAALCGGPISITTEGKSNLQFDIRRMLSWVGTIFATQSDRVHMIGRKALKNLIIYNRGHSYLLEHSIEMCYVTEEPRALESYFEVVAQVISEAVDYPFTLWKILAVSMFTLGNEKSQLRSRAAHLLRTSDERQQKNSRIQDFDVSIADKTAAVYKAAQLEISTRLACEYPDLAFPIFSEFSKYFGRLNATRQRVLVAAILPWMHVVELQVDINGGATPSSYVLLVNLFEITIKFGGSLHNEVQALWQALATGPHAGNVQLVLDFIIQLCLDRREQNFVDFAKQIVVFLSKTPSGSKVVEFLLLQISPRNMVHEKRDSMGVPAEPHDLPYCADLSRVLPVGNKQAGVSLGQLSLVLLVDLMVSPIQLATEKLPVLLQTVFVLWDHYITLVKEQAREMLIHLIHELVISKIDNDSPHPSKQSIEDLIDAIRRQESKVIWTYDESNGKNDNSVARVPSAMGYLATQVLEVFQVSYPTIREQWGKITLSWATSCPVRHLACRSFQIFRCVLTSLDQPMLSDMLARLSNTIADEDSDVVSFSMEILTTLKTIIAVMSLEDLMKYPQLFWTTCACLDTIHEQEFLEALSMLENFIGKADLANPDVIGVLLNNVPPKWEGDFQGVQSLIYKGLRSDQLIVPSLAVLETLLEVPDSNIVGGDGRLLYTFLANVPRFMQSLDDGTSLPEQIRCAEKLAKAADSYGFNYVSRALSGFAGRRYRSSRDFLAQSVSAIREHFFPELDFKALIFLIGLLTNRLPWFKLQTMQLLCVIIPEIDMRRQEIASHGPDLISPLLRLLQTEFCPKALEVLDNIMTMSGTPNDRHHLRMSMLNSQSHAIRKEYERMPSLFGIPDESGWAVPMPAIHSNITRHNVHAVFYMCPNSEAAESDTVPTPDVEFHADEFHDYGFPATERTGTMMSDDDRGEGNMGDLVMKLDSLDDFFDDDENDQMADNQDGQGLAEFIAEPVDAARLYDQQTLPILQRTLARSDSVASFQTGFTDVKARGAGVMSPRAFMDPVLALSRPKMHSRSKTSPANNPYPPTTNVEFMSDGEVEDPDSDVEFPPVNEGSFLENMMRPIANGTRSVSRRLTGSGTKEEKKMREALRAERKAAAENSPQVPKLPAGFLQSPTSPASGQ